MKPFTQVAIVVFVLVGLVHLLRLVTGFSLIVAGCSIPLWLNAVGAVIAFALAWLLRKEARS
jgi:hypothetical protein